jgi:hypothetical protein
VLRERMPGFPRLRLQAGTGTVADNLTALVRGALDFYRESFPMLGSMLSEPHLMASHRESLRKYGAGPRHPVDRVTGYLRAERDLGRIAADADPEAAATLLVGGCFQQAFLRYYTEGTDAAAAPDEMVTALAGTVLRALRVPD